VCAQEPFDRLLERPELRAVEVLLCVQGGQAIELGDEREPSTSGDGDSHLTLLMFSYQPWR
jgi:hypothetical protein